MITIYTLLIIAVLLLWAFFSFTEMAMTSLNRVKLKSLVEKGDERARDVDLLLSRGGSFLGTTLVGTNIVTVISSVLATRICAEYFGLGYAAAAATVIMAPLTLVLSEIVPKLIARQYATDMALKTVRSLGSFSRMFHPLIALVNFIANLFLRPFGKPKAYWDLALTKQDLKRMLVHGREAGEVEPDEVELIHKVLDFGGTNVEKIMVPLYRISSVSEDDNISTLKRLVDLTGYSRIPVYRGKKNNITGVINIYDILFSRDEPDDSCSLEQFVRRPVNVGRKDGLDIALTRLRHAKQPMGVVLDDKDGRISGIVTIEDILEELVGEIEDVEDNI
jgi:CBS domain containing-hemolysin-like protein